MSPADLASAANASPVSAGTVRVQVRRAASHIVGVELASVRPGVGRLLRGQSAKQALTLVPRLFSLCGRAQQAVAAGALAAAGADVEPAANGEQCLREAISEHLWRILLDWPARLGLVAAGLQENGGNATFAAFYRRLRGEQPAAALAAELSAWAGAHDHRPVLEHLRAWDRRLRPAPVVLLPRLSDDQYADLFSDADAAFAHTPSWRGAAVEVGSLAEGADDEEVSTLLAAGRPLAARYRARWRALAVAIDRLGRQAAPDVVSAARGTGVACAWIASARGPLAHRVQLVDDRVVAYEVIAPTEWNFHPASPWRSHLIGAEAASAEIAENLARLWVLAIDPCVPAEITVTEETPDA